MSRGSSSQRLKSESQDELQPRKGLKPVGMDRYVDPYRVLRKEGVISLSIKRIFKLEEG